VSFEYTLMAGVNDSDALADELAYLLRRRRGRRGSDHRHQAHRNTESPAHTG